MYVVFGCGGHARSILDVIFFNNREEKCYLIDVNAKENEKIMGCEVNRELQKGMINSNFIVGIGNNLKRKQIVQKYMSLRYSNIISKDAYIGFFTEFGIGNFLAHSIHIGPYVKIGDHNIINTNAVIEHECRIGNFCHIGPNSTISGRSILGNNVFLGVGSTVIDKIKITDNVIVGAGAVVVNDILEAGTYVGVPARKLR